MREVMKDQKQLLNAAELAQRFKLHPVTVPSVVGK
jgi:hypothetical protein